MTQSDSSETFRVKCPQCDKSIRVPESMLGRAGKCPGCGGQIQIPSRPQKKPTDSPPPKPLAPILAPAPPTQHPTIVQPSAGSPTTTNVFTPAGQLSAVQVNVHNSNVSNSLGIASLILGILSFFICWMPFIGFGLSGLGLLLGIGGLVMSVLLKGTGIGYSIAGTAVSGIGVLLGIVFIVMIQGMAQGLNEVAEQMERDLNSPSQQASPVSDAPMPNAHPTDGVATTEPLKDNTPSLPQFHDALKPLQLGNVQLTISSVRIGKVPLYRTIMRDDTESVDDLLTIWLKVTNTSSNKKIDYQGWMSDYASLLDIDAELTDDNDNRYRGSSFGATTTVKDAKTNESIYPGKSITDAVVFELPIDGAKYLDLTLSAKGCKEDGEFRFRIPIEMIQR